MATHLEKSDPAKLVFRFSTLGATLQAAQAFDVGADVQFGTLDLLRFREGEAGTLCAPEGSWVTGARFVVLASRHGLVAAPEADSDYHTGLIIGGFTIGEGGHPDPATAWDIAAPADIRQLPQSEWTFQSFDGFLVVGAWARGNARHYRRVPVPLQGDQKLVGWADLERAIVEARDDEPVRKPIGEEPRQPLGIASHGN